METYHNHLKQTTYRDTLEYTCIRWVRGEMSFTCRWGTFRPLILVGNAPKYMKLGYFDVKRPTVFKIVQFCDI